MNTNTSIYQYLPYRYTDDGDDVDDEEDDNGDSDCVGIGETEDVGDCMSMRMEFKYEVIINKIVFVYLSVYFFAFVTMFFSFHSISCFYLFSFLCPR